MEVKMRPGQLRQHARLLRARYNEQDIRDAEAARSQAALMEAEAELVETQADIISPAPEEDCTIRDKYPILGAIICKGGKIEGIEYPWEQDHVDALYKIGIDMAFEWCHDPRAGLRQGQLIRIYIGTKDIGPRVMWCDGIWSSHKSYGNYGKNWACGGNWSSVGAKKSKHLNNIAPDLAQKIKEAKMDIRQRQKSKQRKNASWHVAKEIWHLVPADKHCIRPTKAKNLFASEKQIWLIVLRTEQRPKPS
jgi:hypothetical protein